MYSKGNLLVLARRKAHAESGAIRLKVILLILLGVLAVASLVFSMTSRGGGEPQTEAANNFMGLVAERNAAESYAMLTDEMKETISAESWKAQLDAVFADYEGRPEPAGTEPAGDAADGRPAQSYKFTYNLVFKKLGDGSNVKYKMALTLTQDAGSWKVSQFSSQKQ